MLFAQVEEVPALRSKPEARPSISEEKATEVMESEEDSVLRPGMPMSQEGAEQIRSFVTINSMIIIVIVLIVALVFFIIIRRVRRSKKQ
jgi:heme/copper-type cytochrome/quinol oxidase subunit 2